MGVGYKACKCCIKSYYDEYVGRCQKCNNLLCTDCLVNNEELKLKLGKDKIYAFKYGIYYDSKNEKLIEKLKAYGWKENDFNTIKDGELIDDSSIDEHFCPLCNE